MQSVGDGPGLFVAPPLSVLIEQVIEFSLDAVRHTDVTQRLAGQVTLVCHVQLVELAPGMHQTADLDDALTEAGLVASLVVAHQLTLPVPQEGAGVFARPAQGEVVNRGLQAGERKSAGASSSP